MRRRDNAATPSIAKPSSTATIPNTVIVDVVLPVSGRTEMTGTAVVVAAPESPAIVVGTIVVGATVVGATVVGVVGDG